MQLVQFKKQWLALGLFALSISACDPFDGSASAPSSEETEFQSRSDPAFVSILSRWPRNTVSVCFEGNHHLPERQWIRDQVQDTWQVESNIVFTGWGTCGLLGANIRVSIEDGGGGKAEALGSRINNVARGVIIRSDPAASLAFREYSVRGVAVHEFGHAIGFAHEQLRGDTPSWCVDEQDSKDIPGDFVVGSWDEYSTMNYCNSLWTNGGELSSADIAGAHYLYGPRPMGGSRDRFQRMDLNGDGRDDLLARLSWGAFEVWMGSATGLTKTGEFNTELSDQNGWNSPHRLFVMDVDGDNRDDLIARRSDGAILYFRSTGTGLVLTNTFSTSVGLGDANGWNAPNHIFVLNVDNDAADELVIRYADGNLGILNLLGPMFVQSTLIPTHLSNANGWNNGERFFVADVNGDGRKDLVARYAVGSLEAWVSGMGAGLANYSTSTFTATRRWYEDNGNGTVATRSYSGPRFADRRGWNDLNRFLVMDVDGDRDDDFVIRYANGDLNVLRNTTTSSGVHYFADASGEASMNADFRNSTGWRYGNRYFPMNVLGATGDRRVELWARFANGTLQPFTFNGTQFVPGAGIATPLSDSNGWNDGFRFF